MDPSVLTVYESPFHKIRLGKDYDGGYVIILVPEPKYSILLSGGICNDISFETAFCNKFKTKCFAFDASIDKLPTLNDDIKFVKKYIGSDNNASYTDLTEYISKYENIFVKMDIEGGEIPWITSLAESSINKFEQICIEFHFPFTNNEIPVFDKLNKSHYLVHFHGNNCCGTIIHKEIRIPNVFECTYLHKKYFKEKPSLNKAYIPSSIDMKNLRENEEIFLSEPPFVYKDVSIKKRVLLKGNQKNPFYNFKKKK
jgi:hypothetical protein